AVVASGGLVSAWPDDGGKRCISAKPECGAAVSAGSVNRSAWLGKNADWPPRSAVFRRGPPVALWATHVSCGDRTSVDPRRQIIDPRCQVALARKRVGTPGTNHRPARPRGFTGTGTPRL